jgi:hypothetical protein
VITAGKIISLSRDTQTSQNLWYNRIIGKGEILKKMVMIRLDRKDNDSAKAKMRLAGIRFTASTHVEAVIMMTYCGSDKKNRG